MLLQQEEVRLCVNNLSSNIERDLNKINEIKPKIESLSNLAIEYSKEVQKATTKEEELSVRLESILDEKKALSSEIAGLISSIDSNINISDLEFNVDQIRNELHWLTSQVKEANEKQASISHSIDNIKITLKTLTENERKKKLQFAVDSRIRDKNLAIVAEHEKKLMIMCAALTKADNEFKEYYLKAERLLDETEV